MFLFLGVRSIGPQDEFPLGNGKSSHALVELLSHGATEADC